MRKFQSVDEYINSFEGRTKSHLHNLRVLIHEAAPGAEEVINYNIAAFAMIPGGKRDQQIMIAGFKHHVGFYPHPKTLEKFWDALDGFKKAKGSVQFPIHKPLPELLIKKMVTYRLNMLK